MPWKSKREIVISILLNFDREYTNGKVHVNVFHKSFNIPDMTENEFIYELSLQFWIPAIISMLSLLYAFHSEQLLRQHES